MKTLLNKLNVWWNGDYSHNTFTSYARQTQQSKYMADLGAYEHSVKYKLLKFISGFKGIVIVVTLVFIIGLLI